MCFATRSSFFKVWLARREYLFLSIIGLIVDIVFAYVHYSHDCQLFIASKMPKSMHHNKSDPLLRANSFANKLFSENFFEKEKALDWLSVGY